MEKNDISDAAPRTYNVLFLCTGNSARSILAESILNRWGDGRFKGMSAGSHPKGAVHPWVIELLRQLDFPTAGLRSKDWNEFAAPNGPHWGIPDPVEAQGTEAEKRLAFREALRALETRIKLRVIPQVEQRSSSRR